MGDEESQQTGVEAGKVRILPDATEDNQGTYSQTPTDSVTSNASNASVSGQHLPPTKASGPSVGLIVGGIVAVLVLSCLLLTFATVRGGLSGLDKLAGLIPNVNFSLARTPTVTIDTSRPSVLQQVRALSRLETVNYQLEKVITGQSSGPLFDFLTSDKILLVAHGDVVAGVDLEKLESSDIQVVSDTVIIRLPEPEVLSSKLDNEKTYVYDRQTGIFSKPDPNLESQMRVAAEQQIVQAALEDGIIERARENAKQTLRTLLLGLGYQDVEFKEEP